ncbi:hypothetical protein D3C76_1033160 [compost metagenome]
MSLAKNEHGKRGQPGTRKGEADILDNAHQLEQGHADDDRQRSTCVDAKQPGFGQRITCHRLHQRPGHAQGQARQNGYQGAGNTQFSNHQMLIGLWVIRPEGIGDFAKTDGA